MMAFRYIGLCTLLVVFLWSIHEQVAEAASPMPPQCEQVLRGMPAVVHAANYTKWCGRIAGAEGAYFVIAATDGMHPTVYYNASDLTAVAGPAKGSRNNGALKWETQLAIEGYTKWYTTDFTLEGNRMIEVLYYGSRSYHNEGTVGAPTN